MLRDRIIFVDLGEGMILRFLLRSFVAICCVLSSAYAIVGGRQSPRGLYPFVIALGVKGRPYCTGTLVDSQRVLTAGHCFFSLSSIHSLFMDLNIRRTILFNKDKDTDKYDELSSMLLAEMSEWAKKPEGRFLLSLTSSEKIDWYQKQIEQLINWYSPSEENKQETNQYQNEDDRKNITNRDLFFQSKILFSMFNQKVLSRKKSLQVLFGHRVFVPFPRPVMLKNSKIIISKGYTQAIKNEILKKFNILPRIQRISFYKFLKSYNLRDEDFLKDITNPLLFDQCGNCWDQAIISFSNENKTTEDKMLSDMNFTKAGGHIMPLSAIKRHQFTRKDKFLFVGYGETDRAKGQGEIRKLVSQKNISIKYNKILYRKNSAYLGLYRDDNLGPYFGDSGGPGFLVSTTSDNKQKLTLIGTLTSGGVEFGKMQISMTPVLFNNL